MFTSYALAHYIINKVYNLLLLLCLSQSAAGFSSLSLVASYGDIYSHRVQYDAVMYNNLQ